MATPSAAVKILVGAYDDWIQEEQPDPALARASLGALQQALYECQRRGGRLASIPLLLKESSGNTLPIGATNVKLSSLLPDFPPASILQITS